MRHLLFLATVGLIASLTFVSSAESQGKKKKTPTPIWSENKDAFGDFLPIGAISRIGTVRYRLSESRRPETAVLSPDCSVLAVLAMDSDIELWELPAWNRHTIIRGRNFDKKEQTFFQHLSGFSADGKRLLACDLNRQTVFLIDVATGAALKKFSMVEKNKDLGQSRVQMTRDEKTLVWAYRHNLPNGQSHVFLVWDMEKNQLRHRIETPANRNDGRDTIPVLSADGRWLLYAGATDNANRPGDRVEVFMEIWDLTTGKAVRKIDSEMQLASVAFSPDGKWIAATDGISVLRFYDAPTGKEVHNIRMRRTGIGHLDFAPDSKSLYVVEYSGAITQWDPVKGEKAATFKTPNNINIRQLAFLPDGNIRGLGLGIEAVHYLDVKSGKMLSPTGVPTGYIDEVSFAPNGELFVAGEDGLSAWWNTSTGLKLRDLKLESDDGPNLSFSPYSEFGGREIFFDRISPYRRGIGRLSMARNGEFLIGSDGSGNGFYNAKSGKLLYDSASPNGNPGSSVFLAGGDRAASLQQKKIRVWQTRNGRDLAQYDLPLREKEQAFSLAASPNGKFFSTLINVNGPEGNQGRCILFDAAKNKVVREWPTPNGRDLMTFSPDEQWLAGVSSQSQVRLIRLANPRGDLTIEIGKNSEDISQLAFSPDGRLLACSYLAPRGYEDSGKIVVIEMATRKVRQELVGHPWGYIDRLSWSHDSALLASGANDTTVLTWEAGLRVFAKKRADKVASEDELNTAFDQLAGVNPKIAFQHMIKLVQSPDPTVKLLGAKIAPAKKTETGGKNVPQWIHDLGSETFAVRSRANAMLLKLGSAAEPELKAALPKVQDVETKRRVEDLLDRIALNEWDTDQIREARAVEVLEAIGTSDVRAVLTRWSTGEPGAVLTREARSALAALK